MTTSSSTSQGEEQGVPDSVCSQHPAGTPDRPPGGCVSRTLHGLQSPSTWFLTSSTDRDPFDVPRSIKKARFLSVRRAFFGSVFKVSKHT